ncbi:MAG: hypothetical protein HFJ49_00155 [Clostridia bacterium]|nr:hypothetical protein [Clostridia bacterium]
MKKFLILFSIVIVILSIIWFNYTGYKSEYKEIQKSNLEFEKYYQKEVYGIDLTTVINKAIDENTRNKIEKDTQNKFRENEENSIKIDIKITDTDKVYTMEDFYNGGISKFVQYYGTIKFKCTNIEYHKKTEKIRYLYFEQIEET